MLRELLRRHLVTLGDILDDFIDLCIVNGDTGTASLLELEPFLDQLFQGALAIGRQHG